MKLNKWIFLSVLVSSCSAINNERGNFRTFNTNVIREVTINHDNTFVFSFSVDACPSAIYGGIWRKQGRYLYLTYIGSRLSYFKSDTAIYGNNGTNKPIISVRENDLIPMDSMQIKINNSDQIYFANRFGNLFLKKEIRLDSLKIRESNWVDRWTTFKIPKGYNEIMIYLYNVSDEPCGYFYIPTRFRIINSKVIEDNAKNKYKYFK